MPKVKIPRKSTIVDMTAMCDVAFLLLTFFILATKQKPDDVLAVTPPNSISSKAAPDNSILITLTKEGKTFITLGDETKKKEILEDINTTQGLGLSAAEINKWNSVHKFIGMPLDQTKSLLALGKVPDADKFPGIPTDSANNEMIKWVRSITNVYAGGDQKELQERLLVKGDNNALYPRFKAIKEAFKANDIYKYRIVTNGESVPVGSEAYLEAKSGKKID